jgi:hypothetical protein
MIPLSVSIAFCCFAAVGVFALLWMVIAYERESRECDRRFNEEYAKNEKLIEELRRLGDEMQATKTNDPGYFTNEDSNGL